MIRTATRCAMALVFVAACGKDNTTMDMNSNKDMAPDLSSPPDMTVVPPTFAVPGGCAVANVTLATVYPIINTNCATVNCHRSGATTPVMGPNDMNMFRTNVVNVSAARQPASLNYVTPNNLDNSFLVYKVTGQQAKVQFGGAQMPNNQPPLSATDQCTIINWVRSGAN
jgi:hypothetical protein